MLRCVYVNEGQASKKHCPNSVQFASQLMWLAAASMVHEMGALGVGRRETIIPGLELRGPKMSATGVKLG